MKQDLRYKKTENLIIQSFFELMDEVGLKKINVAMIVEKAGINRSTFYAHYIDKFDLLEKTENQLLDQWYSIGETVPSEAFADEPSGKIRLNQYMKECVDYLYKNGQKFSLLMGEKGDPAFTTYFSGRISALMREMEIPHNTDIPEDYFVEACIGSITSIFAEWVKRNFEQTPEQLLEIIYGFMRYIFRSS